MKKIENLQASTYGGCLHTKDVLQRIKWLDFSKLVVEKWEPVNEKLKRRIHTSCQKLEN